MKTLLTLTALFLSLNTYADHELKLNATYALPVELNEELPYALFNLKDYTVKFATINEHQEVTVTYSLPSEMVGEAKEIKMKLAIENGSTRVLEGEEATALCVGKWIEMKCDVRFKKLNINLLKVRELLESQGTSSHEIDQRIKVLSRFSGDPIGVSQVTQY